MAREIAVVLVMAAESRHRSAPFRCPLPPAPPSSQPQRRAMRQRRSARRPTQPDVFSRQPRCSATQTARAEYEHNATARVATTSPQQQLDRNTMSSAAIRTARIIVLMMAAAAAALALSATAAASLSLAPPSASPSLRSFPDLHPHRDWKLAERPHPHHRHCFQLALRHGEIQQQQQQSQPTASRYRPAARAHSPAQPVRCAALRSICVVDTYSSEQHCEGGDWRE